MPAKPEVRTSRAPPEPHGGEGRWQIWAGAIVALGCLATVAYAVIEVFWG